MQRLAFSTRLHGVPSSSCTPACASSQGNRRTATPVRDRMKVAASTRGAEIRRFPNFPPFPLQRDFPTDQLPPRKELSCRNVSARRRSDLIEAAADSSTQNVPPPLRGSDFKQNGETNEADLYDCGAGAVGAASYGFGGIGSGRPRHLWRRFRRRGCPVGDA